jgi:hypothetical protein
VHTQALSNWPQRDQPLPTTPCAQKRSNGDAAANVHHPPVYVTYTVGGNFGCGTELVQTFTFDERDGLLTIEDAQEHTTCL